MDSFGEYIAGRGKPLSRRELGRLVERYEWFTTARRARALVTGEGDSALTLPLMFWPTVPPAPARPVDSATELHKIVAPVETPAVDLIDRFIAHGGYRIAPEDEAPAAEVDIDIDPEMVTEELAEIYRAQGLTDEAEKIYRILKAD